MIAEDAFPSRLLAWFDRYGRHDLPWQHPRSPYRTWIAEVMLQQTQVATVIPYYLRFLHTFPTLPALAAAPLDEVLAHWSGLGYYSRARNLQGAARRCVESHAGDLPTTLDDLCALPGVGRSTAAAILAQAHGQREAILDGNVKRLLCRLFGIDGWPGAGTVEKKLWQTSERLLPQHRLADYTQALMDFGSGHCRRIRPLCDSCPFKTDCLAHATGRVDQLPQAKPRKQLPQRSCTMLLVLDGNRALLERRPPAGVWAGLWSLPQFESPEQAEVFAQRSDLTLDPSRPIQTIEHAFSHYRLSISALLARKSSAATRIADDDQRRWIALDGLKAVGLPAPVRTLLENVACTSTEETSI